MRGARSDDRKLSVEFVQHLLVGCSSCREEFDRLWHGEKHPSEDYEAVFDRALDSALSEVKLAQRSNLKLESLFENRTAAQVAVSLRSSRSLRRASVLYPLYERVKDLISSDIVEASELASVGDQLAKELLASDPEQPRNWDARLLASLAQADVARRSSEIRSAAVYIEEAGRALERGTGAQDLVALFYHRRGLYYSQVNRLDAAIEDLERSRRQYLRVGLQHEAGMVMLSWAMALGNHGRIEEAIDVRMRAAVLIDFRKRPRAAFMIGQNMAMDYAELGMPAVAIRFVASTRERFCEVLSETDELQLRWSEGRLLLEAGRPTEAETVFEDIQSEYMALGLPYEATLSAVDLCLAIFHSGRINEATEIAASLVSTFASIGYPQELLASVSILKTCESVQAAQVVRASVEAAGAGLTPQARAQRRQPGS
ncbi:MAG: hypothetical protein ACE5GX_19160 [Thermoanaerobaculia bacterium]